MLLISLSAQHRSPLAAGARLPLLTILLALLVLPIPAPTAAAAPEPEAPASSNLSWDVRPERLVLSFTRVHEMLAWNDPVPLLRIYGDGRVLVHIPEYMLDAGDYTLQLGAAELQALLQQVQADGTLQAADAPAFALQAQAAVDDRRHHISDASHSLLTLNVAMGEPGSGPVAGALVEPREIVATNVAARVASIGDVPESVRAIARTEARLDALVRRAVQASTNREAQP